MDLSWDGLLKSFNRLAPEGSPLRKMLLIIAVILVFEGISVLLLFSYDAAILGVISIAIGFFLVLVTYPRKTEEAQPEERELSSKPALGIRLVEGIISRMGGDRVLIALGISLVASILLYNEFISVRPNLGDLDTLAIMLGLMMIAYPFIANKFLVEAAFSLLFLGIVALFLVVPQAVMSIHSGVGTSAGNLYVHYMLSAPFAGILNLIGIPASSSGSSVTMTFIDGSVATLGISAYCAGLYSFSIFVSAFISFVFVFEKMKPTTMAMVLGSGLLIAYLGNLFRMVIIGIVGYYNGMSALLWAHKNVGWIIFLSWSAIFWYLVMRYAEGHSEKKMAVTDACPSEESGGDENAGQE